MYLHHHLRSVLVPLGLTAAASATVAAIRKLFFWIWDDCTDNLEGTNGRYHQNS